MKPPKKAARKPTPAAKTPRFSDEEVAAMKERVEELKAESRRSRSASAPDGEHDLLAKIAALAQPDRAIAERLHALIKAAAPHLEPKTWYGMPAWARNGSVVCYFQSSAKFKTRYSTLGFSDKAKLDEGRMWPTVFALAELTPVEEARITALLKKALS